MSYLLHTWQILVGGRSWQRWPMRLSCVTDTKPAWLGSMLWGPPSPPSCCSAVAVEAKSETRALQPNAFGHYQARGTPACVQV